ncbi:MAG: MFS transporter [Rhodospirillales bacterium]|nr:MFS transporter [Rhodospirillales bacterium]
MLQTLKSVSSLMAGLILLMLGSGALTTLLGLRMGDAGFSSQTVGFVMAAYFFGLVIGPVYAHKLISTIGHIRAYTALGSILSVAALAHPFFIDPWFWGGLRFIQGFCIVGMYMCTESWLNAKSTNQIRGQVFAIYQVAVYLFQGAAQFLLNIPDTSGYSLYILTSVLVSLAVVPVALIHVTPPELPKPVRLKLRQLYAISPTGMIGCMASGALLGSFYGMGASYAQLAGLDVGETTRFMGAVIVGGLVLQWPFGKLSDVIDRRFVILATAIGTLATCLLMMNQTVVDSVGIVAIGILFGGVSFTLYPICVAYTNDYAKSDDLVPVSAGLLIAYGLGAVVGPIAASQFMQVLGAAGLFVFCGTISAVLAVFIGWRMLQRPATIRVDDQMGFKPMGRTTAVISELDTRADDELTAK